MTTNRKQYRRITHDNFYLLCEYIKGNYAEFNGLTDSTIATGASKALGFSVIAPQIKQAQKATGCVWLTGNKLNGVAGGNENLRTIAEALFRMIDGQMLGEELKQKVATIACTAKQKELLP